MTAALKLFITLQKRFFSGKLCKKNNFYKKTSQKDKKKK